MSLTDKVNIEIELGTFATLIAGLYCTYGAVNPIAIPESLWIELAEKLEPYLKTWDYSVISFEDFIKYNLLIIPRGMLSDDEVNEYMQNTVYFERENGNVILSVTFEI